MFADSGLQTVTPESFSDMQVYELEVDRIFVTYFGGDEKSGLAPDLESKHIWLKYLPSDKVLPLVNKVLCMCWLTDESFWQQGILLY